MEDGTAATQGTGKKMSRTKKSSVPADAVSSPKSMTGKDGHDTTSTVTTGSTNSVEWLSWTGCYDENWRGLIVDEAFAHPAKAARGLLRRIFDHMEAMRWLRPGDRVLDVFGGIGTTAIEGASRGMQVVCIELEKRFADFAEQNWAIHRRVWEVSGDPLPVMILGDSRKAVELVRGHCATCVSSPPFGEAPSGGGIMRDGVKRSDGTWRGEAAQPGNRAYSPDVQGSSPGQLSAMPEGDVAAAIGSPPFVDARQDTTPSRKGQTAPTAHDQENWSGVVGSPPFAACDTQPNKLGAGKGTRATGESADRNKGDYIYGESAGQLGVMREGDVAAAIGSPPYAETPITGQSNFQSAKCPDSQLAKDVRADGYSAVVGSPPYAESLQGDGTAKETAKESHAKRSDPKQGGSLGKSQRHQGYGGKENLGNLAEGNVEAAVGSPPFEGVVQTTDVAFMEKMEAEQNPGPRETGRKTKPIDYGSADGQLGNTTGETFWSASRTILEQVHRLLKPGGVCAWIVKDYVKKGQRVPFCDNWARLCEAVGFRVVQRVRCWLVKEETNPGLFGSITKKTERKSFFRRLHERKPGAVRIDWEEVVFAVKVV